MAQTQENETAPSAAASPVSAPTPASTSSTAVGSAISNAHPGSNVTMPVADTALRWEIQNNSHGDTLPIIPSSSHVEHGKVLYQLTVKITLTQISGGNPVSGKSVSVRSSRSGDVITPSGLSSGADGEAHFTLQSRNSGDLQLTVENPDITAEPLSINLKDAWYESAFLITGYNVCEESDFGGQMTNAVGL